jgi:hypothetical protein
MTYISINGHTIRRNIKRGTDDPPIRIARTKSDPAPVYAREVRILGPSRLIYDPAQCILKCGARLALQTAATVEVVR